MAKILIDTVPVPSTCNRCGAFVLAALSGGRDVAADPVRLSYPQMVEQLRTGRQVFRYRVMSGERAVGLDRVTRTLLGYDGAKAWSYVAAHGCGCHPQDVTPIAVEDHVYVAPCEAWMFAGWVAPIDCPKTKNPELLGCGVCDPAPF